MNVELSKKDLVSLVMGTPPDYNLLTNPLVRSAGRYVAGFVDKWYWSEEALLLLSEEQLWEIYTMCRDCGK